MGAKGSKTIGSATVPDVYDAGDGDECDPAEIAGKTLQFTCGHVAIERGVFADGYVLYSGTLGDAHVTLQLDATADIGPSTFTESWRHGAKLLGLYYPEPLAKDVGVGLLKQYGIGAQVSGVVTEPASILTTHAVHRMTHADKFAAIRHVLNALVYMHTYTSEQKPDCCVHGSLYESPYYVKAGNVVCLGGLNSVQTVEEGLRLRARALEQTVKDSVVYREAQELYSLRGDLFDFACVALTWFGTPHVAVDLLRKGVFARQYVDGGRYTPADLHELCEAHDVLVMEPLLAQILCGPVNGKPDYAAIFTCLDEIAQSPG